MKIQIPRSALIVAERWGSIILDGAKIWELRSSRTKKREHIGLIAKGTGTIIGTVEIIDCLGPLSEADLAVSEDHHCTTAELRHAHPDWRYAWVLNSTRHLHEPVPYDHPSGAQMFVTLSPATQLRLRLAIIGRELDQVG